MEKEPVEKFDLEAAFKALDEIEIPETKGIKANRVDLKERFTKKSAHESLVEDYYDITSNEDLEEAQEEREGEVAQAKLARIEKIVDLDAETADDLLPSYVGKVIIQCPQCMTLFYKNPEDIEHSEENPDVVNINEICQHCGNSSGYTLIGKVDSVGADEADRYEEAPVEEAPVAEEENELDLDFGEPTEEVDAEGTGEAELSDDELAELDLDLAEVESEEDEEEKKEESLNLSKAAPSEFETEHKSENLTLNEEAANESLNNSEELKDAEEGSELKTENESENLTLNEEVDKDLDAKLKAHNDYIAYLQQMIKQEEEALKKAENDEIKAAIQRRLDAFNADLEAALPDAVKEEAPVEEIAEEPVIEEEPTEVQAEEEPKEEPAEEEAPVEEALTEDGAEEEKPAEGNEVDYVEYKHSYCHALAPKLKAINYLVNVKKVEPKILKGYILKLLKDADVKWTEKEKEFKKNIEEKEDVYDILNYVKNSIEKAKTLKVKVDANGELVESLNEGFEGCLYEKLNESLNKSEAAVSENDTENHSENLTLNEDIDPEIDAIINSWGETVKECLDDEENFGPGRQVTNINIDKNGNVIDVQKRVADENGHLPPLKEEDEVPAEEEAPVEEPIEEEPKEELPEVDFTTSEVKEVATDIAQAVSAPVEDEEEAEKQAEEIAEVVDEKVDAAVEEKIEAEQEEASAEDALIEEEPVEEALNEASAEDALDTLLDSEEFKEPISDKEVEGYLDNTKNEGILSGVAGLANGLSKGIEDIPVVGQILASDEAEKKDIEAKEGLGLLGVGDVNINLDASGQDNTVGIDALDHHKTEECFKEDLDDLDEASFNEHINNFLQEVYSNVKSFEATSCELTEGKLIVEGCIKFNSGKEKSTVFEFFPLYGEGKLFLEGYNKDFANDKAFKLNCSINEAKELITEQISYRFKINETLVEGLK